MSHQQPTEIWEGEIQTGFWVTAASGCLHSTRAGPALLQVQNKRLLISLAFLTSRLKFAISDALRPNSSMQENSQDRVTFYCEDEGTPDINHPKSPWCKTQTTGTQKWADSQLCCCGTVLQISDQDLQSEVLTSKAERIQSVHEHVFLVTAWSLSLQKKTLNPDVRANTQYQTQPPVS